MKMSKERKKQQKKLRKAKKRRARARNRKGTSDGYHFPGAPQLVTVAMQQAMAKMDEEERQRNELANRVQQSIMDDILGEADGD
jgi:hypothetical protein